jgi:hypothetical protein
MTAAFAVMLVLVEAFDPPELFAHRLARVV